MKSNPAILALAVAASVAISIPVAAQTARDQHHPGGAVTPAEARPSGGMGQGMAQQSMPGPQMRGSGPMGSGMMGQGMMGSGMMGRGMMGGGMMQMMAGACPMMGTVANGEPGPTYVEGRVAFLKAELGITDAQKAAWDAYAAALRKNLESMHGMRQNMMTAMSAKSPVERFDARLAAMEGRVAAMQALKPVLAKLYTELSDEQKKKADQMLTGMGCMM